MNYFKNRLNILEKTKLNDLLKYEDKIRNLEKTIENLKCDHKKEVERLENNYNQNVNDLEKQITKQRERTVKLLSEKDAEIERMKANLNSEEVPVTATPTNVEENNLDISIESKSQNNIMKDNNNLNDDSKNLIKINSNLNETTLLHYSQELAFRDAELSKLRKFKIDLESRIKNISSENETEIENYKKQINILKLEIERLKLNTTRLDATTNMEYIKNVVYRFLTTKDINTKVNMINAISQILQFTKNEKYKALSINS